MDDKSTGRKDTTAPKLPEVIKRCYIKSCAEVLPSWTPEMDIKKGTGTVTSTTIDMVRELATVNYPALFRGEPGAGKTTLIWNICIQWARCGIWQNVEVVFFFDLQKIAQYCEAKSARDLIKVFLKLFELDPSEEMVSYLELLITTRKQKAIFIFDGIDKIDQAQKQIAEKDSQSIEKPAIPYVHKLFEECCIENVPLILIARLGALAQTSLSKIRIETTFEVRGFKNAFTLRKFLSTTLNPRVSRSVTEYMQRNDWLQELCMNPRIANIVVQVLHDEPFFLQETKTAVLQKLIIKFIEIECPECESITSLFQLPPKLDIILRHISLLAFKATLFGAQELGEKELSLMNLSEGVSSLVDLGSLGLVYYTNGEVHFLTLEIQRFLSAYHVSILSLSEQVDFYCENGHSLLTELSPITMYHFGLGRLNHRGWFNSGKLALGSAVECLARCIDQSDGNPVREMVLVLLSCINESREESLVGSLARHHFDLLTIELFDNLSYDEKNSILFMLNHSDVKTWNIHLHASSEKTIAEELMMMFVASLNENVKISIADGISEKFLLKPTGPLRAAKKSGSALAFVKRGSTDHEQEELFKHAVQSDALREVFHRVLNLYSKFNLNSDASDPAFLSIITCECVEEKLLNEVLVGPIHPVHFVKLTAKSKKVKRIDSEREISRKHVEEEHKQYYTEIIVLSKPYPKSLTFQPPGSLEQCELVLSTEKLPSCMSGRIASEARDGIVRGTYVTCRTESEMQRNLAAEMVTHGLPLPKSKTKSEAEKVNASGAKPKPDNNAPIDGDVAPVTAAQVAPSHRMYKNVRDEENLGLFSPVQQAESTEKTTWRPGMIMYTTMPDIFQKHKSYALPAEDHQIRRGGNGQIFAANYAGYTLVAKKTHFRNREYNIIIQLKHTNIVPLLALMVGEVSHRRRFFCYHMLPRMSGDVARMLSDHPNLTLAALKLKHAEDPLKFGLALGNMRYLLAEVLKGLAYMHSLHIVHRDVKASNILVRFHCQHENLLWCTCTHKYTVCVCDFDAAVELGPDNALLPISQSSKVFYLPPVGTQGFRSPEGSQLVVASHSDVIVPHLTQRSDVWSMGILMLRLFLGEDGPSTQRHNSILLLKYYQMKGLREGAGRMAVVGDRSVERLLKLHILRAKLSGVSNLVDFVSVCLHLDPEQRPTSSDLLKHKFLY